MLVFGRDVLQQFDRALTYEWLETNRIGGFASSSILGINTRRYHGLLVAALKPPVARYLLLAKYEEVLWLGGQPHPLSANLYPGAVHPTGHLLLTEVRLEPCPTFRFDIDGLLLEKRVFLREGENTAVVQWQAFGDVPAETKLHVRPLLAFRDYHSVTHANGAIRGDYHAQDGRIEIQLYADLPALFFVTNAKEQRAVGEWYYRFQYPRERDRGLEAEEDLFCPFELTFDLVSTAEAIASLKGQDEPVGSKAPRRALSVGAEQLLERAAGQFLIELPQPTVIAGYPWFTDWGRDTMISLPGLAMSTGRSPFALGVLNAFAGYEDKGMLPNRFPDAGGVAEYNTVDAALWFFEAVAHYVRLSGDLQGIRDRVYPALKRIIDGYLQGTRFEIHADKDHLIHSGPQLTWMDAVVDGRAITPRAGKAVEIQALWYNALRVIADLAHTFGEETDAAGLAEGIRSNFEHKFWNRHIDCLYDLLKPDGTPDASIRPNQVFALSLTHPIATHLQAAGVINTLRKHLLTPYGLRTLAPSDPQYISTFKGGPGERDTAYHQGTVWPWLLGPFATACRRFGAGSDLTGIFTQLIEFAEGPGCGQLPEVFDGDPPHNPGGCIAQAWSVAEVLRCLNT